jgi:hypothetical protein
METVRWPDTGAAVGDRGAGIRGRHHGTSRQGGLQLGKAWSGLGKQPIKVLWERLGDLGRAQLSQRAATAYLGLLPAAAVIEEQVQPYEVQRRLSSAGLCRWTRKRFGTTWCWPSASSRYEPTP